METPPDEHSGGVVRVTVILKTRQPVNIRTGQLELALVTTHFSRTTLDGYHEHSSEDVRQSLLLCERISVQPGTPHVFSVTFTSPGSGPEPRPSDSRPVRMQWQVKARFVAEGQREIRASAILRDVSPAYGGAPVVDGTGFLPLYGLRLDGGS